jgi:predicted ATPase/DNA-binding SARP family transcriptional activator
MKSKLKVTLLGSPQVFLGKKLVTEQFITRKAEALFYYLVVTQTAHRRDQLAVLLWPDATEARARKNIRDVLPSLRKLLGDYLVITRQTIAFNKAALYWLDVERLATAVTTPNPKPDEIAEAIALYRGDFLEGFYIDDSPEYENWFLAQKERWREFYAGALHWLTDYYLTRREFQAGLLVTQKLLEIEPWAEAVYRQRMLLYAYSQQPYAALQTYKQCQAVLAEEFDTTPAPETERLYQRLRLEVESPGLIMDHNLPRNLTPFFGRNTEMGWLRTKLLDPNYPLLTIMGEGGMGKTRLALAISQQVYYDFADGVWFVPLANIASGALPAETEQALAAAIAQAMEVSVQTGQPIQKQVLAHLRSRHLLLVLDNMEHLLNGRSFLLTILQEARRVQLLVTSRTRLLLQAEQVYQLDALPAPEPDLPAAQQANFASLQLFAERANRTGHPFMLQGENIAIARQICHLVGGLPLAIELAAALLGQKKGAEIIAAIEQGATNLALAMQDIPPRHRSLQAVFDYSWQLLAPPEQAVLAQCAIFAGPFPMAAAAAVAQATRTLLQRLTDHSLLRQTGLGLYTMHPLVREFCQQKLQAYAEEKATAQRHVDYYLNWLQAGFMPQDWDIPLRQLAPLLADVQQAWETAVANNQFSLLANSSFALARFFDRLGQLKEIEAMLAAALSRLRQQPQYDRNTEARLMASQTYLQFHTHQFPALFEAGEYILAHTNDATARLRVIGNFSRALWSMGKLQEARQRLLSGQATYQAESAPSTEMQVVYMRILQEMGITAMQAGEPEMTQQHFEEALGLARSLNNRRAIGSLLHSLAIYYQLRGRYYDSLQYETEALAAYRQIDHQVGIAYAQNQMAFTHLSLGQYDTALQVYEQVIVLARHLGMRLIEGLALLGTSHCYQQQQNGPLAIAYAQQAWSLYAEADDKLNIKGDILTVLGRAYLVAEQWAEAYHTFEQSLAHWQTQERSEGQVEPLAGLARTALYLGQPQQANKWANEWLALLPDIFPHHEDIWDLLWAYWMIYETLQGLEDVRGDDVWCQAKAIVLERANHIPDAAMRRQFLTEVPVHRRMGLEQ